MKQVKFSDETYPTAMTIAGSDSGGGAGIEADLRTFSAFGVFGCAAITAVTSQNPREVRRVDALPPEAVRCQIETVLDEIDVRWVKTGMLFNSAIVEAVADLVVGRKLKAVIDPVMVATSGATLLENSAIKSVCGKLIPAAQWITPNLPEAELLLGRRLATWQERFDAALECYEKWGVSTLLKSGHAPDDGSGSIADCVCRKGELFELSSPRLPDCGATHGTGCTLSSALAAALAMDAPWKQALCEAKAFVFGSLVENVRVGRKVTAMYPPVEEYSDQVRLVKIK
ncbi:MAG: bifunctional hydroxymethylpyrimidine kinase/phosphomethylpyrimidine kinase [Victivallaceae bacterium]|nr:bifunctional hydroxymethylpyrimidine kinase/phosphomethylpyrimidine kinase [Victivallaceae bacterium]